MKSLHSLIAIADANPEREVIGVDRSVVVQARADLARLQLVIPAASWTFEQFEALLSGAVCPAGRALADLAVEVAP